MRVELSTDPRDFVARDWTDLVRSDPVATFFHQPRYLKLYWEEFGHEGDLVLAFGREESATIGAVAFERVGATLRFLGGTEVTDYMGPVARPGSEDGFAKELFDALHRVDGWTDADLRGLPSDSPWLERLHEAAEGAGLSVEVGEDSVAPFLPLPGTTEEYLAGLPGKLRHEIKRKARKLREETGGYDLVRTTAGSMTEDLDCFVQLHRSSEGPKGKFMEPGMEIFFRRLGQEFLPDGEFRLTFIRIDGVKVAGAIGFAYGGTLYLYNSAYDREWSRLAPGMVLVGDLIVDAIGEGCRSFDMLKGDLQYKYRFGATPRPVKRLVIRRG
jgi:CelD/BcsL family acetyltransferase involved in cellulose biosynthesis